MVIKVIINSIHWITAKNYAPQSEYIITYARWHYFLAVHKRIIKINLTLYIAEVNKKSIKKVNGGGTMLMKSVASVFFLKVQDSVSLHSL